MDDKFSVTGEWYFEHDGLIKGPFFNSFPPTGLAKIAEAVERFFAPYLVIGDDLANGYTVIEAFRKPVSIVNRDGPVVRFRTQLLPTEANGDHQKTCIYVEGADTEGSGIMLNLLTQPWSKASNTALTVECRVTIKEV